MTQDVAAIMASTTYRDAVAVLDRDHDRIVDDIIRLTEIASPPFGEDVRGDAYLEMLRAHGLTDVEKDTVGNVMGLRRGIGNGPLIVVAAHLDTVFPAGTNVTVRREGTKLFAPGIGDDTRSLAVLLGFMRAMDEAGVRTTSDILFVGDVGEEGLGDLRGVRHLFQEGKYKDRIKAFFTVDSPEMTNIATGGIGSRRWRGGVSRSWRPQLRGFRTGEPDERHGSGRVRTRPSAGSWQAQDDLQRERGRWRNVNQRDPERGVDRGGPAVRGAGRTGAPGGQVPRHYRAGSRR
jgi:Peptidase family M20/M25/M40